MWQFPSIINRIISRDDGNATQSSSRQSPNSGEHRGNPEHFVSTYISSKKEPLASDFRADRRNYYYFFFCQNVNRLLNADGVLLAYAGYGEHEAKTTAALVSYRNIWFSDWIARCSVGIGQFRRFILQKKTWYMETLLFFFKVSSVWSLHEQEGKGGLHEDKVRQVIIELEVSGGRGSNRSMIWL